MSAADHPLLDLQDIDDLGADLRAARYDVTGVPSLLGPQVNAALGRDEYWPALRITADDPRPIATLTRLFLLGAECPADRVAAALPRLGIDRAIAAGVLEFTSDATVRAALDIRPHADDSTSERDLVGYLVISDLDSGVRPGPVRHDHVLGIGQASVSLANAVIRSPVRRALDLGTGCGIQALHLDQHCEEVVGTDTNPRALALAAATARINGMRWDLRAGSVFDPVDGERFDLIVSNPPFVIGGGEQQYIYRDSGMVGDAICEQIVTRSADHLEPGGILQLLANWVIVGDDDWRVRVQRWVDASGLDGWVVQRDRVDPVQYVSLWLQDAGEEPDVAARRGDAWLDWFAENGVTAIGMGSITLRRRHSGESGPPDVVLDEITGAGQEVTGAEAEAFLRNRRRLVTLTDRELLSLPLRLADAVVLVERSILGHDGWSAMLRMAFRPGGPGAVLQVDEWGRMLLAGCRGEAPVSLVIEMLAAVHDLDDAALTAAVLPSLRVAIGRGLLTTDPG